jgi:hypothetical protein
MQLLSTKIAFFFVESLMMLFFEYCPRESNFAAQVLAREAVDDSPMEG